MIFRPRCAAADRRAALVTDGNQRAALAITRSLGRRGIAVIVADGQPGSLASTSRYCRGEIVYPSPYADRDGFQRFLLEFVARHRVDVVVPVADATTQLVSMQQRELSAHTAVAVPSGDAFQLATDKWALLQHAASCGVPIPETWMVEGMSGLDAVLGEVRYPAVVKPVRPGSPAGCRHGMPKAHYVFSAAELRQLFESAAHLRSCPALIQERIVGQGAGVFVLLDRGRLRTAFAHRRLRERPPSGGVSVLSESVAVDPLLLKSALDLLSPLRWHGVAMIEFKHDDRSGRWVLMEVNGRFWGSLQLAIDAGVDFPYLTWQLALGHELDVPQHYATGIRSRWLLGDVDHLLARLFNRRTEGHYPGAPTRARAVLEFLKLAGPGLRYDVLNWRDPGPAWREVSQYARDLAESSVEALRRQRSGRRPPVPALRSSAFLPDAPAARPAAVASVCLASRAKPIRVCHLMSGDLWAGAEVQLATAASYLVQHPDVRLSAVLLNRGRLESELRALGVQVSVIEEHRHGALGIVRSVCRLLRDRRVDVLHTHRYKETILGTIAAKLACVPHLVRTVHGLNEQMCGWRRLKLGAYHLAERAMLQLFSDRLIAVSKDIGRSLVRRGYRAAAVRHVPNGVDLRKVQAARCREEVRRELGIDRHALLVGTVGRLAPVKGHKHLLQAAALMLQQRPDARFLIVGDGPLRAELTAAAAHLGSGDACVLTGERTDTSDLVAAMDVFVLPSLDEGIPMAVLEAMALGTPVVATAVGGVPELVIDGLTGLLVPPRDDRRLAAACLKIASDRQLSQTLADAARRVTDQNFSSEKNGAALVDIYRRLVRAVPDAPCTVGPLVESRSHAHAGSRLR